MRISLVALCKSNWGRCVSLGIKLFPKQSVFVSYFLFYLASRRFCEALFSGQKPVSRCYKGKKMQRANFFLQAQEFTDKTNVLTHWSGNDAESRTEHNIVKKLWKKQKTQAKTTTTTTTKRQQTTTKKIKVCTQAGANPRHIWENQSQRVLSYLGHIRGASCSIPTHGSQPWKTDGANYLRWRREVS